MDTRTREREIAAAWEQHDPTRARVPPEAWRAVRIYKRSIAADAERIHNICSDDTLAPLLGDWSAKGKVGKARALNKLKILLAPAQLITVDDRTLIGNWLHPRGSLIISDDPSDRQDCIVVSYLHCHANRRTFTAYRACSIECPDHATARMLQRAPGTDITLALRQAHSAFLGADLDEVLHHVKNTETFYLPCADGLLVCTGVVGNDSKGQRWIYARARTWISNAMKRPDQQPIPPASNPQHCQLHGLNALMALNRYHSEGQPMPDWW
jgi:hypothetical protein